MSINSNSTPTVLNSLQSLLESSQSSPEFQEAVRRLSRSESPGSAISTSGGCPPVKVLRTITKLLEMEPALPIERVQITAQSGCSDFSGTLIVNDGEVTVRFKWDCAWRAQQEGFEDAFGYPDQIRAAQTFGYQCFEEWQSSRETPAR